MSFVPHYVADTHAVIWHISDDHRLTGQRKSLFSAADNGQAWIHVSAITLVEIVYLVDRGKIEPLVFERVRTLFATTNGSYQLADVDLEIVNAMLTIPRDLIPDMPDRIIAATARSLGYPLLSADGRIRDSGVVEVIW